MAKRLQPHEQRVLDALLDQFGPEKVSLETPGQFRSPCPAHGGNGMNMVAYLDGDCVKFHCFSENCAHTDIRDALGLTEGQLRADSITGCTLSMYADLKKLPVDDLLRFGLSDTRYANKAAVRMPYWSRDGARVSVRYRVSTEGKAKVRSKKNGEVRLYGMWKLDEAVERGFLIIVEGESDCHTLWHHELPAVGIPGAQQVNLAMPDLLQFLDDAPEVSILLVEEPDLGGKSFVRLFERASFRDRVKVVRLGEFKDPSELHCDDPSSFLDRWDTAMEAAIPLNEVLTGYGINDLGDLRPEIERLLAGACGRPCKIQIANMMSDQLLKQGRLLVETEPDQTRTPYFLHQGAAVRLTSDDPTIRLAVQDAGLNPTESAFNFVIAEIIHRATRDGKAVELHRFSIFRDEKLYVSAGPTRMVVVETIDDEYIGVHNEPNGYDGVLFASDGCFAPWESAKSKKVPTAIHALRPRLDTPPEVAGYDRFAQWNLLSAWMTGVVAGVRLPILTSLGGFGSGKSFFTKALCQLFMGSEEELSNIPSDARSFLSAAATLSVYGIDNLDGPPPPWLEDALAAATTGAGMTARSLYTNARVFRRAMKAKFAVTTRTADFAKRKDLMDRTLPLFFGHLSNRDRVDEGTMLRELRECRDEIMTWLALLAFESLSARDRPQGLPSRFQDFAHILVTSAPGNEDQALAVLEAMEVAQQFAIRDPDALLRALVETKDSLQGSATQIVEELRRRGYHGIPKLPGKRLARLLREMRRQLQLVGRDLLESPRGGTTYFTLVVDQ